jgi:uncharacterized protein
MFDALFSFIQALGAVQLSVLLLTVVGAGFLRGFVGFGAALIIVMVLSAMLGPAFAVPAASLAGVPSTLQLLPDAVRHAERPFVTPFGLGAFVAAPLGAMALVIIDPTVMRIVISVFVLVVVLVVYRNWRMRFAERTPFIAAFGALAGLTQGATGSSGPMAVALALSRKGAPHQQRANVIGTVTALNLCGMVPFWYHGLYTLDVVMLSLAIMPAYSLSTWWGARYFKLGGSALFRNVALAALAVIGVITLGLAVQDYIRATSPL